MVATLSYIPCPSPRTRPRRPAGRHHHAVVLLHQHEKKSEGAVDSYGYESPRLEVIVVIATPQVQPLRAILRNDTSSSQQYPAGVPGARGWRDHALLRGEVDDLTWHRSMRRQQKRKGKTHLGGHVLHGGAAAGRRLGASR